MTSDDAGRRPKAVQMAVQIGSTDDLLTIGNRINPTSTDPMVRPPVTDHPTVRHGFPVAKGPSFRAMA